MKTYKLTIESRRQVRTEIITVNNAAELSIYLIQLDKQGFTVSCEAV